MKTHCWLFLILIYSIKSTSMLYAQDVYISVPTSSIFNRSEFITVRNIMNTQGHSSWRAGTTSPHIKSNSGDYFTHTSLANTFLPTSVLQWRLSSIGGQPPPFKYNDVWPGYKWLTTSYQTWYQPAAYSSYNAGNVAFSFRIPAMAFESNSFYAGLYKIQVAQDYGRSGWYAIEFSPEIFNTYISIPEEIRWLAIPNVKYFEISSLNQFRSSGSSLLVSLGSIEIGHTVDYNLFAKADKNEVRFKALNGSNRNFAISNLKLGSNSPKVATISLSNNWKNYSVGEGFKVIPGNISSFELELSTLNEDFKTHFFEAGTYTFQIKLDARATTGSINTEKKIDVTISVPLLSEIVVPGGTNAINFVFNTVQQYNEGQSKSISNQLRISNNQNYELYVKASAKNFYSNGIQSDIKTSILEIGVEGATERAILTTDPQKIISNGTPVLDKNLNITYNISANSAQSLISKEKKSYAVNVIYSFTAL